LNGKPKAYISLYGSFRHLALLLSALMQGVLGLRAVLLDEGQLLGGKDGIELTAIEPSVP
jgi:hypothetical protein